MASQLKATDNYDPTTGTFLTRDPLDGVDGATTVANPYHYTNNDPLNRVDPLGPRPTDQVDFAGKTVVIFVNDSDIGPCAQLDGFWDRLRQNTADHAAGVFAGIVNIASFGPATIVYTQITGNSPGGTVLQTLPFTAGKYCSSSPAFWTGEHLTAAFAFAGAGEVIEAPAAVSGATNLPPPPTPGTVTMESGVTFSAEEVESANFMAKLGYKNVELRAPVGTRAGGGTTDLLVDGVRWDVYSPIRGCPVDRRT